MHNDDDPGLPRDDFPLRRIRRMSARLPVCPPAGVSLFVCPMPSPLLLQR
jgi:hypothetical protein